MDTLAPNGTKRAKMGKNVRQYFREYCSKTSIHGMQYVGERNRNIYEKIWWLVIVVISIALCSILIQKTYKNWRSRPIIVTLAEVPTPVYEIPFPAVTICPSSKVPQTIFNYTYYVEKLHKEDSYNVSFENLNKLEAAALICEYELRQDFLVNSTIDWNVTDIFTQIGPLPERIFTCFWMKSEVSCSDIFRPILTEEGLCYTFNMLDTSEIYSTENKQGQYYSESKIYSNWSLDRGYTTKNKTLTRPRRSWRSGINEGLSILLIDSINDTDYCCSVIFPGHKIIFHNPAEVPRTSEQFVLISKNHAVVAALNPNVITTSPNLKNYQANKRLCYYSTEKPLRFFKVYTQKHCEIECLQSFILGVCECVPYFLPSGNATPICGYLKKKCYMFVEDMAALLDLNDLRFKYDICIEECLPSCTSLTYNVETSLTEFNRQKLITLHKEFKDLEASVITVFFKETEFIELKRNELYGWTDFIANCGGLLGLFMGVSFLSVIEIVYFLTLRLWQNLRNQHIE